MEIDIAIDKLTDCLIDRRTGQKRQTEFHARTTPIFPQEFRHWKFDWCVTERAGFQIYELFVVGDKTVQGRISLNIDGGVANVDIAETAPHNFSHAGKYEGVGAHLFAIACHASKTNGCDGVVAFTAKSSLVEYYKEVLHAVEIAPRRLVIFEQAASILLDKYIRK